MLRWLRAAAVTALWSFMVTAWWGLAEAGVHLARHGLPVPPHPSGVPGALLSALTLSGWFGVVVASLAFGPLMILTRRRPDGPARSTAIAVAWSLAVLAVLTLGSAVQDAPASLWWRAHLGTLWAPRLTLAALVTIGLARWWRHAASALLAAPALHLFGPLTLLFLGTLLWPAGDQVHRRHHLAGLTAGQAPAGSPNLVLLSIDALRRDKLSCLDDQAPATPHLDALAAEGRLFTNAWSVSSWTLPAMATALTGLPPRTLGVSRDHGLPPAAATLAQVAWRHGWDTAAVVANPFLGEAHGLPRGFAHADHADVLEILAPAAASVVAREATRYAVGLTEPADGHKLVAAAGRWLARRSDDRPFFLWIHLMEPHLPYRQHGDVVLPAHPLLGLDGFRDLDGLRQQLPDVPQDVRQAIEALYDGEVRRADHCVGAFLDQLAALGLADRTWVVIMSDHGEEFFEHGGFEHGHSLLPAVTGIPLLVRPPAAWPDDGLRGTRDPRPVSLLDLAPSLCLAMGWTPPDNLPGRPSLVPGAPAQPAALVVLENMLYGAPQQATLRWPDLRVLNLADGADAWYRLDHDPDALTPTSGPADTVSVRRGKRALLDDWDARGQRLHRGDRQPATLDAAARRRLRSLGY